MKPIEERIEDFRISLQLFQIAYTDQVIQQFFEYWTEPTPSGKKFRKELEKTWDTSRRLARWHRNNLNWNKEKRSNLQNNLELLNRL